MLNKDNVKLWLDALRSGKYPQAQRRLATENGFCCLGVACEVAIENGIELKTHWRAETAGEGFIQSKVYNNNDAIMPHTVMEWLGFTEPNPNVTHDGQRKCVAGVNDAGVSFEEIADALEAEGDRLGKRRYSEV